MGGRKSETCWMRSDGVIVRKNEGIREVWKSNFELFEKGLLLRINDMQKFYLIALNPKKEIKIDIFEGKKE